VLATELKNNANKLAKWTAQALLAGAEQMKLGYVSRVHPKDSYNHVLLTVQGYKPKEFAAQINLSVNNMWGILKTIVDICMKLDEGKYLLVKDPNKPIIRLYAVPTDAFENDYAEEPLPEDEQAPPPPETEEKPEQIEEKDADLEI
jgi:translation initiation factor 3 subunit D